MKCEGCDKPLDFHKDYYINIAEFPAARDGVTFDVDFCSWYCASSIVNEKYSEEREAEKAMGA